MEAKDGSFKEVEINEKGNEIIIKPIKKTSLDEMLSKINSQNLHSEIDTEKPVGKEAW